MHNRVLAMSDRGNAHVPSELARTVRRAAYGATQLPRVAWYIGHSLLLRELAASVHRREKPKVRRRPHTHTLVPDRNHIYADMTKLFLQDLANVEAGIYPVPTEHDGSLLSLIRRSRMFFDDLPNIHRRRERRAHSESFKRNYPWEAPSLLPAKLPLSVGRLDDGQFGQAVRHPGRSSF